MRFPFLPSSTLPFALATLLTALTPGSAGGAPADGPDYEALARSFLARHGVAQADPQTLDLAQLVRAHFLVSRVGLFEVHLPADLSDKDEFEDYRSLVGALLAAQGKWLGWLEGPGVDLRAARSDLRTVEKWVESWRWKKARKGVDAGLRDMLEVTGAKDGVRAAAERFANTMARGEPLGLERAEARCEPLVLLHDRRAFIEFLSFGGWLHPHLRSVFWQPGVVDWTHCYIDDYKVLALEYAAPGRSPGDIDSGVGMSERTPTGMEQQVVQLAFNSLIDNYFGERVPPSLAGALAVNLVIDLYGECNTRVDGDLRVRRTQAREVFVPGGASEGGVLPPNLADSRWRAGHGEDRFVHVLRAAMKAGKSKKRRGAHGFLLLDENEVARRVVTAPFLGSQAAANELPDRFLGDHVEFLRAYRSCFVHWLQTYAGGSKKQSNAAFAELLRRLALNDDAGQIEATFQAVYDGTALSARSPDKKVLEGRFLQWISRRK